MCERALPAGLARQWEQAYPGTTDQVRHVRTALREYLGECPVAEEAIHLLSELSANAIVHSDSGRSGGTFTVRAQRYHSYVWGEVEDQGSDWDGDLPRSALHPHGLYFLQVLASAYGVERIGHGRIVYFRIDYPLAQSRTIAAVNGGSPAMVERDLAGQVVGLPERRPAPLPASRVPPRWEPPDLGTLARVHGALTALADSGSHPDTAQERPPQ